MKGMVFSILLLASSSTILRAEEAKEGVAVREPIVEFVRHADLQRSCGSDTRVEACTAFAGQRLDCACGPAGDGWRMEAHAQFIPVMYIDGPEYVAHERDHIEDIRASLARYLESLRMLRFHSAEECRAAAALREATFLGVMDALKVESQTARHPRFTHRAARR